MAAALVALNAYLRNTLRIPLNVVDALNMQGLETVDDLLDYTDSDVTDICRNCRRPGGVVAPGGGAMVAPNPGVTVGHTTVMRLKQLRFYRHHCDRVQRAFHGPTATSKMKRWMSWRSKQNSKT